MELKDVVAPKWVMSTKRGWGMVITFAATMLPFVNMWVKTKTGVELDAGMIALFGEAMTSVIDAVGVVVGVVLMVWGMFRPTAPLVVVPPKAE